ncbi:unnamed protein product [Ophioblennius macclurei]
MEEEPSLSEEDEEEEEKMICDEDLPAADMETEPPPIGTTSVPFHEVQPSGSAADGPLKPADGAALNFSINGRLVHPGGGSTKLTLRFLPGGSASGFTSVQTPVAPKPLSSPEPPPDSSSLTAIKDHTPIITGVVSGEAAHRVLDENRVQVQSTSSPQADAFSLPPQTADPASPKIRLLPKRRPGSRNKLFCKGELVPRECSLCKSSYKLVSELRGFLCMCSPAVTHSLMELKKRRRSQPSRRSREEHRTSKRSRVSVGDSLTHVMSPPKSRRNLEPLTSPSHSSPALSPTQIDRIVALPPQGKLVILVEDFYYGSAPGNKLAPPPQSTCRPYRCTRCPQTLRNNISLMSHMQQHQSMASSCPHCLRHFLSPSKLQQHVEQAHVSKSTAATCRICELAFDSEPDFLWHMRNTHKPGEMPYSCQVCDFRSSFFSDVWTHFQSAHGNTENLLCHFCLRVLHKTSCYLQHLDQHQSKRPFTCEKCRLHFLYLREHLEHKRSKHTTHVKPPQLSGLKPGTKVTVRTYSVVGGTTPCKVVDVPPPPAPPPPPPHIPAKRRRLESLKQLQWSVDVDGGSGGPLRCSECLSSFSDPKVHFPSVVTCALCKFSTCCSASYANHMLSHHAAYGGGWHGATEQPGLFTPDPSLPDTLKCVSCTLNTHKGDLMANHLAERPQHACMVVTHRDTHSGESVCVENGVTHTPAASDDVDGQDIEIDVENVDTTDSVTSLPSRTGSFVPIELGPAHQASGQLSVKPLVSPPSQSFPPAMTIKFLGANRWSPVELERRPLTKKQLAVVLFSLCHGVHQAVLRFQISQATVHSWTEQQRRSLPQRRRPARTAMVTELVLSHRETEKRLDEDVLLQMARTSVSADGQEEAGEGREDGQVKTVQWEEEQLLNCYNWTVDLMLRQELGLDHNSNRRTLTRTLLNRSDTFVHLLSSEIETQQLPPHAVGCMDEFPIFMDLDLFKNQDQMALQFSRADKERPLLDVVLSALSDGTFLTPLLCFSGLVVPVPDGFPDNVVLETRQQGFTQHERLNIWVQKVWQRHSASQSQGPALVIMDSYQGHQNFKFRSSLSDLNTVIHYIPAGCCCSVQPLDMCVKSVLRDFLQTQWTQLVADGGLDGLSLNQLALTLACWFSEFSSTLTSETRFLSWSFSSVFDMHQYSSEAEKMIADLTNAVIQPPQTRRPDKGAEPEPEPKPEPDLEARGEVLKEVKAEKEELVIDGLSPFRHVFKDDSDTESFHGFLND